MKYRGSSSRKEAWSLLLAALFLVAVTLAFSACGTEEDVGGTFSYAELSDPEAIDPALVSEEVGWNITRYLYDGLVLYDPETGEVIPGVAEDWEINEDATEFTFFLRDDVKFSNGREVVAEDFVYSWTRALKENPASMNIFEPVQGSVAVVSGEAESLSGVEAVDDQTLKVTLEFPQAEFVTFLGHPVSAPVPREEVESAGEGFAEMPIGNGPYTLKEWKRNQELVLEKNADYYGEEAKLDQVVVKIVPDPATAAEELKAGNIDAIKLLPPGMDESLAAEETIEIVESEVPKLQFAAFNMTESPWSDSKALREAFNYAIDRETIADVVLQGQASPAYSIVPPTIPGHQQDLAPYTYDPEMAKTKLEEASYPNGEGLPAITLTYPSEGPFGDVALAMQSQLKDIGVNVELSGLSFGDFIDQMEGQQLSFFIISWGADYPSPDTFLYTLFSSDLIGPGAPNVSQYSNDEVDTLLNEARMASDTAGRLDKYREAEKKILEDAPVIPLVFGRSVMAHSTRVTKFVLTPLGEIALNEVTVSDSK